MIRIYENNAPLPTPVHFRWSDASPTPEQPIFITGNPGATQRLLTQAQLATVRDVTLPLDQLISSELRGRLIRFGEESAENRFIAADALAGVENTYKRGMGRMRALIDARFMGAREAAEAGFRRRAADNAELTREIGDPWADLADIQPVMRQYYPAFYMLETRGGGGSQLYTWANQIVRAAQERARPNAERLVEYGEARLPAVQRTVLAEPPIYPALDTLQLSWWLEKTREVLTVDDPRIRRLLGDESPEALARRVISGTRLGDPAVRRAAVGGRPERRRGVGRSADPFRPRRPAGDARRAARI